MTFSHINRTTATVLTAAAALGAAGPAVAQPLGNLGPVPVAPPQVTHAATANALPPFTGRHMRGFPETTAPVPAPAAAPVATARPKNSAPGSDVVYVLIGGAVVALGGLGGTLAATSRRRTAPARARIAA
ncbi:MAG TPA: hypothetical protein VMF14_19645 [Solirubrobacteraceae bacterium]|nr:hypothetical protein [Solirubrobacteraceae bacterium]